jgi:putative NADH-flavin reductase
MNVTIFGATSGTGHILAEKCLAAGYNVTALVRDASKFDLADRCRVVNGDARDPGPVCNAVRGANAVFSTLGAKSPFEKSDLLARAVPLIVTSMVSEHIRRLIVLGSGGWQPGALDHQTGLRRAFFDFGARTLLKYPIESQRAQEAAVIPSPLDWTIVAPSRLSNAGPREASKIRLDTTALPPKASQIARADVASVMFRALEESAWLRQRVYVTW